jgi:hypothetical protein
VSELMPSTSCSVCQGLPSLPPAFDDVLEADALDVTDVAAAALVVASVLVDADSGASSIDTSSFSTPTDVPSVALPPIAAAGRAIWRNRENTRECCKRDE